MKTMYFDDVMIDEEIISESYRVEETEIIEFARKWDPQPFHTDPDAAADSIFKGLTACSVHIFAVQSKLSHTLPKRFAVLAGLGLEELTFSNAVRPGDELVLKVRVLEKIESKSKQDRGVIRTLCEVLNQNGEIVFRFIGRTMVARRTDLSL